MRLSAILAITLAVIPLSLYASHVPDHVAGPVVQCTEGLSWDANSEPDIAGYHLFVGSSPDVYGPGLNVPHNPGGRIIVPCADAGVVSDGQYYFTADAFDLADNVSPLAQPHAFFLDRIPQMPMNLDAN